MPTGPEGVARVPPWSACRARRRQALTASCRPQPNGRPRLCRHEREAGGGLEGRDRCIPVAKLSALAHDENLATEIGSTPVNLSPDEQRAMLRQMQTIRRFEERASDEFQAGHIYGVVHCYIGQEAVAVGVCSALTHEDQIISTHRGHGHCIAKGADLKRMMAELYGRYTGYCKGKGGSMHIADFGIGMLGANGIVAGGIPIVTGAGLAAQLDGTGRVAVSFFGDGASSAGPFHECLNIAAAWKLPMLYVCENNCYGVNMPASEAVSVENVADRAAAYG